jgi:hypothetical protein
VAKLTGKAKRAFLRRMAKGRNKAKGGKPKRKRAKHHHKTKTHHKKGHHVARKRKHSKKGRRRSHVGGGMGKYIPPTNDLISAASAFAYGKLEQAATTDANHMLKKVPALVPQLGRAGNLGAILWLGAIVLRQPIVKAVAKGVIDVAAYQNGRGPSGMFTKDAQEFRLSGPRAGRGRDEVLVEQYLRQQGG